jgi:hypothetical protein
MICAKIALWRGKQTGFSVRKRTQFEQRSMKHTSRHLLLCTLNISARPAPGASSRQQGNECTKGRVPSGRKSGAEKIDHGLAGIFVTDG